MKILHTSDIHLKGYGDERWKALRPYWLLEKEKK
jgi:DNA repair exonuclease SbcCD nuclease subunit